MNTSFENKIQNYISDNKEKITLGLIVILSLVWRYAGRNFLSADMEDWLLPWYEEITKREIRVKPVGTNQPRDLWCDKNCVQYKLPNFRRIRAGRQTHYTRTFV